MAELLRSLQGVVSAEDSVKIAQMLESVLTLYLAKATSTGGRHSLTRAVKTEESIPELQPTVAQSHAESEACGPQEDRGYTSVDNVKDLDTPSSSSGLLDENLHEDYPVCAINFVGQFSEVNWLRAVSLAQLELAIDESVGQAGQRRGSYVPGSERVASLNYWMDDENVNLEAFIQPYHLPQPDAAEHLVQCYMLKVHESFPILPRKPFEDQFRTYFRALQNGNAPRLSPQWQAILNLVFAIGAKYSHLVQTNRRAEEGDHLMYQARARTFGLNEASLLNHSDVPHVQSLGLLAFYWLAVGQISR